MWLICLIKKEVIMKMSKIALSVCALGSVLGLSAYAAMDGSSFSSGLNRPNGAAAVHVSGIS